MAGRTEERGGEFLTVAEAARRLGRSRLRVREAVARGLLPSRRDNEGRLRVDIPDGMRLVREGEGDLAPEDIIGFLFDDIEDLEATLDLRDGEVAQLLALAGRQDAALAAADDRLTDAAAREEKLSALLERALSHLEGRDAELSRSLDQVGRYEAALDRALALAERRDPAGPDLTDATEKAMSLLEDAIARAEAGEAAQAKAEDLLDRTMRVAERLRHEADAREAEIARQAEDLARSHRNLDAALAMSERATDLALQAATKPKRRGLFRRLLGLSDGRR